MTSSSTGIHGYVSADEHEAFRSYAERNLLGMSGLASLLVARCLSRVREDPNIEISVEAADGKTGAKVTAHRVPDAAKKEFERLCQSRGLTESALLRFLCISELKEQWLAKALTTQYESYNDSI